MGLDQFLDFLVHKRLFFTNAKNLTDNYEVSLFKKIKLNKRKELEKKGLKGSELNGELAAFEYNHNPMRDLTLVNCWSLRRHESYALWKIYLDGANAGAAIRTNVKNLKESIEASKNEYPENIYMGKVQYKDYLTEQSLSRYRMITTKREFYEYENELRMFILHHPLSEGGVKPPYDLGKGRHLNLDLSILVGELYLSPFSPSWFQETLVDIIQKVAPSLTPKIKESSIRDR